MWVKQFQTPQEKTLAWLILRHLVFRTTEQLESCMRQALKAAATHFISRASLSGDIGWQDALRGAHEDLDFYCGPPSLDGVQQPGKSGELMTRSVHRNFSIDKYYPHNVTVLSPTERYLVVDDGTYTGTQIGDFLEAWRPDYEDGKVAIVVGIAHEQAIDHLQRRFPSVSLFCGELLTQAHCLTSLSREWVANGQWQHETMSPEELYLDLCTRKGPFERGQGAQGFGGLGAIVAYEHGAPDDSLQLLWNRSSTWTPLIER